MRILPRSLSGRLILTLVLGLVIAQIIGSTVLLKDRQRLFREMSGHQLATRVVSIVNLMENQAPGNRLDIARAISTPTLRVQLLKQPRPTDETEEIARTFQKFLNRQLPDHPKILVTIEPLFYGHHDEHKFDERRPPPYWKRDRRDRPPLGPIGSYLVQVVLKDGTWLAFQKQLPPEFTSWPKKVLGYLAFLVISILLLSILVVRQITRPLATLSDAAEQLGKDINRPPLSEKGSREVAKAAAAFNQMQQRLKRYIDDRSELLAAVSHDLKTPITRLRLRTELLNNPDIEAKFTKDLDEMEQMVQATLEYMRGIDSKEPLVDVDLNALLETIEDDALELGWPVELTDPGAVKTFKGRPLALKRCLWNLIENAVRYGGNASIKASQSHQSIKIEIVDDGPGIPEDKLKTLFEPFTRGESSRNRSSGGMGLGLAIAQNLAHAHGGEISLRNRSEGGLVATLTLPL